MSHIARVECEVRDLDALDTAATMIGATLRRNQTTHRAYNQGTCAHAITVNGHPEAYEVGVVAEGDRFRLAYDNWGPGGAALEACMGHNLHGLQNEYLAAVASKQLGQEGWEVQRSYDAERQELRLVALR